MHDAERQPYIPALATLSSMSSLSLLLYCRCPAPPLLALFHLLLQHPQLHHFIMLTVAMARHVTTNTYLTIHSSSLTHNPVLIMGVGASHENRQVGCKTNSGLVYTLLLLLLELYLHSMEGHLAIK